MSPGEIIGLVVGSLAILAAVGRLLRSVHRGINLIERLVERVEALEKVLTNGISSAVKTAASKAEEAARLAGQAAQRASVAEQRADEGLRSIGRAVNALRGEVDIYTNVVLSDRQRLRATLRELGHPDPDDDDND